MKTTHPRGRGSCTSTAKYVARAEDEVACITTKVVGRGASCENCISTCRRKLHVEYKSVAPNRE